MKIAEFINAGRVKQLPPSQYLLTYRSPAPHAAPRPKTSDAAIKPKHNRLSRADYFEQTTSVSDMNRIRGIRGEIAIWNAVITQAVMDAFSKAKNPEMNYWRTEALHYLSAPSRDLMEVCEMGYINYQWILKQVKILKETGVKWRKDAGEGERYLERKAYRMKQKRGSL